MSTVGLFTVASLALIVGPVVGMIGTRSEQIRAFIDGFSLVIIVGICTLIVVPHGIAELGPVAFLIAGLGLFLPWFGHRIKDSVNASFSLVGVAVLFHLLIDGAVLAMNDGSTLLAWAIVIHRLPMGFAVAVSAQKFQRPIGAGWTMAGVMVLATMFGFLLGPLAISGIPHWGTAAVEAFVAGVLLHVALGSHQEAESCGHHEHASSSDTSNGDAMPSHDYDGHGCTMHGHHDHGHHDHGHHDHGHHDHGHHDHGHHDHSHHDHSHHGHSHHGHGHHAHAERASTHHKWAAAGTILGVLAVLGGPFVSPDTVDGNVSTFFRTLGVLLLESAPALLLGYALAGVVPFLLTASRTESMGRGGHLMQSLRGVVFGLPLPICSCGVLPLYESLIRRGAPPVAAMAFFVATPELGLDAVLLSVPLLGTSLTVARVVAAFFVALLVALLVGWRATVNADVMDSFREESTDRSLRARVTAGIRFGFVDVFDHTMPWIALGLFIAAAAEPLFSHEAIASIPAALQVPLAALIGVPIYVCASGATPVAALAIHKGLSTGAAMAFLIAGPATNVTTFGVLSRLHGRRVAIIFGLTVTGLAVLAGWVIDGLGVTAAPVLEAHASIDKHDSWLGWLSVISLSLLVVASLLRQGPRGALNQIFDPIHAH